MENGNRQNAMVFKAFCDENRLAVLQLLCSGEKCACRLQEALHIGQSTLSHHMKLLCNAGVVSARKDGKWTYYRLNGAGCDVAAALLQTYTHAQSQESDCTCAP